MNKLNQSVKVATGNQRSLSTLKRAIEMSLGQFSLILVRCNYVALQEKITQQLEDHDGLSAPLKKVSLPYSVTTLFSSLEPEVDSIAFSALIVFGLESVEAIDTLLVAANQVRDEFRKHFSFPLVLWINDEILQKLTRFAPDFKSWASTSIKFNLSSQELIQLWQETIDNSIQKLLEAGATKFLSNHSIGLGPINHRRKSLEFARADLKLAQIELKPLLEAAWFLILGRDAYVNQRIEQALHLYEQSLNFLQAVKLEGKRELETNEIYGLVLFHMALCHCHQALKNNSCSNPQWEKGKKCFQLAIELFAVENYLEWVAELTIKLSEVLQQTQCWEELQAVTLLSLKQSATYNSTQRLGRAYGFLAQVALANSDYTEAKSLAENALEVHSVSSSEAKNQQALYLFLLAKAQSHLGKIQEALKNLEKAKEVERAKSNLRENPQLYLQILGELRSLYFSQQDYLSAFKLKQEQQSIEQQCGLRAFLGTSSSPSRELSHLDVSRIIAASGRQRDINNLIERLSSSHHKLTVIHGSSGVGKSYLIKAGLVPSLWGEIIGAREVLPIVQTARWDWEKDLIQELVRVIKVLYPDWELTHKDDSANSATILQQLQENAGRNFLTVLIFDQFEELFFLCTEITERFKFYRFLKDCLNIPYVKVILSLREEYLHHLLHWERLGDLDVIDNNILTRQTRYHLGELSHEEALNMIKTLTDHSQFQLEDSLIKVLAQDLALARGTVRPVELQVVGAQLQAEKISTLQQYRQLGPDPKTILVGHSLQAVISDCGQENEDAVWQVLFSLTNERGTRPLKTKAELVNLPESEPGEKNRNHEGQEPITSGQLNLILNILVDSGLVFRVREEPEDRYQIVNDYLVPTIRDKYKRRVKQVIEARLQRNQLEISRVRRQRLQAMAIGGTMAILALAAGAFGWRAEVERKVAYNLSVNSELNALSTSSETLFVSNKPFDALLEGLRAAYRLKDKEKDAKIRSDTKLKVITALEQAVYGVIERNRLEGHDDVVWGVNFSSDGQKIATASRDKTIKIWDTDGRLLKTISGHEDSVTSVVFNHDNSLLASSSWDGTVKLWKPEGKQILTISAHSNNVYSVNFSKNGRNLITTGGDGLIKLWNLQGQHLKTISGHAGAVNWASFSPDGKLIASAGEDRLIKLWTVEGKLLRNLQGHTGKVNHLTFSPDGTTIASVSDDKTIKLWTVEGKLIDTLQGHQGWVFSVNFSSDGQLIASVSDDNKIKLWTIEGKLLQTLQGHGDGVTGVSFSPDGETLASTSYDKTIKLWGRSQLSRHVLRGHTDEVKDVDFSTDGNLIASAGKDHTVKLWTREGQLLETLRGHNKSVSSVSFSPDGQLIASASHDKTIKLWSKSGELLKTLSGHQDWVLDVSWSNNNQLLASASRDKTIKIWDAQDGTLQDTLKGHIERVNSVSFNANDQVLASGGDDKTLKLWIANQEGDFSSQRVKTLSGNDSWVLDTSFSPSNTLNLIPNKRTYFPLKSHQLFGASQKDQSSQILATAGYDNTVRLWDIQGKKLKTLKGHTDSVARLSFNPTGEIIATTTWDNTIQLWRLDDTLLHSLKGHEDRVTSVSWSKDGKAIATASSDRTIIIWNLDIDELTHLSCDWLENYLQNNPQVRNSDQHLCQ